MQPLHPEFAPVAFTCALLLVIPLPWHWNARKIATLSLISWLFICNIIYGIDALIWGRSLDIVVPVWCDITTKIIIGVGVALPSACLCISIHLERLASVRNARSTPEEKVRRRWFEVAMCFGLPSLFMVLHYVVQGHRYDIIEGYGCRPATYFSIAALFLVWIPPMVISFATFIYSALAFRHFMKRRSAFSAHLTNLNSSLNTTHYLRLIAMSAVQMVVSLAFSSYTLWFTATSVPMRPWTTWADVHSDFLRVDQFPDVFVPRPVKQAYYVLWWLIPVSTLIFVAFFSFGRDARREYSKFFASIRSRVLPKGSSKEPSFDSITVRRSEPQRIAALPGSLQASCISLPSTTTSFPTSQISNDAPYKAISEGAETKKHASHIYHAENVLKRLDTIQV